ncbi:MAG: hypothetical protein K2N09_05795 [Muribaculaceae bacterium]|nr:hypothetical protein [Muribaculaceae bacterium]
MITRLSILLILGTLALPAYANRYSSSGEALFVGALQGLFIMLVVWIWKFIKSRKTPSKTESENPAALQTQSVSTPINTPSTSAWDQFRNSNKELANSIVSITSEDLSHLSSKDLNDKITTFKRMANHFNCDIPDLKDTCVNSFTHEFNKEDLPDVINKLSKKAYEESERYSISKENTMSHYIQIWLTDYISR